MPYRVKSAAGPWQAGEVVPDADFNMHPFHDKFLRSGAVEKVGKDDDKARPAADQSRLNQIDAQLAELNAERALLVGAAPGPADSAFVLPAPGEAPAPNQDEIKAAGNEVIQPTATAPNVGEVVPADDQGAPLADASADSGSKAKK